MKTRRGRRPPPDQSAYPLPSLTEGGPRFTISRPSPQLPHPTQELDLPKAMRKRVAKRLQPWLIIRAMTTDKDSSMEEEQPVPQCRHPSKRRMGHTAGSTVVKRIMRPHEVVYTVAGKPASYKELSIPSLFKAT